MLKSFPTIDQRKIQFQEALTKTYAGCLFDVDGTLTVRGDEFIPDFLQKELAWLALKVPVGICTARKFEHAYQKIAPIFEQKENALSANLVQENFVMICENGCIGYLFDIQMEKYLEFFRVDWPYDEQNFRKLFEYLRKILKAKLDFAFTCEVSMIFRPKNGDDPDREALAQRAAELATVISLELKKFDPKNLLDLGDSGTGVTVFPKNGNKENGTIEFAKLLRKNSDVSISADCREIIVVGDQPVYPGNDTTFLDGRYGTSFTVGKIHPENISPLPVFDDNGKILGGPDGTSKLLHSLFFKN